MGKYTLPLLYLKIMLAATLNLAPMSYDGNLVNNLFLFPNYIEHFNLDASRLGLTVAIVSAGSCVIGPFAGTLLDRVGRKRGMLWGSLTSVIAVILQASAPAVSALLVGRFLLGAAIVLNITASTSLVMELAHPDHRGVLMGLLMSLVFFLNVFVNVAGILLYERQSDWAWRGLIVGEGIEPALSLGIIFFLDESPRWLVYRNRPDEALEVLIRLHADGDETNPLVQKEYQEIRETLEYEKSHEGSWKSLIMPFHNFRRFLIAVLCTIFSQITGAYTIPYFQTLIITSAGITSQRSALLLALGISIWTWLSMLLGSSIVDRLGRKAVFLGGTTLMTVCLAVMAGLGYGFESTGRSVFGVLTVTMLFIFMGAMASSWLLLAYIYPPEVLKFSQRAKGIAISQAIGYGFSCMNQYVLPIAVERIKWRYYAMVAGWNVVLILVMAWLFIETSGKTLEEVDQVFEGTVHSTIQKIDVEHVEDLRGIGSNLKRVGKMPTDVVACEG